MADDGVKMVITAEDQASATIDKVVSGIESKFRGLDTAGDAMDRVSSAFGKLTTQIDAWSGAAAFDGFTAGATTATSQVDLLLNSIDDLIASSRSVGALSMGAGALGVAGVAAGVGVLAYTGLSEYTHAKDVEFGIGARDTGLHDYQYAGVWESERMRLAQQDRDRAIEKRASEAQARAAERNRQFNRAFGGVLGDDAANRFAIDDLGLSVGDKAARDTLRAIRQAEQRSGLQMEAAMGQQLVANARARAEAEQKRKDTLEAERQLQSEQLDMEKESLALASEAAEIVERSLSDDEQRTRRIARIRELESLGHLSGTDAGRAIDALGEFDLPGGAGLVESHYGGARAVRGGALSRFSAARLLPRRLPDADAAASAREIFGGGTDTARRIEELKKERAAAAVRSQKTLEDILHAIRSQQTSTATEQAI